nr:MAG TPA: hypothetical protein [Caudoviricetes sp.]
MDINLSWIHPFLDFKNRELYYKQSSYYLGYLIICSNYYSDHLDDNKETYF